MAFEASLLLYQLSKSFPVEERYSLTVQMCRSSRSVCANMAEAFRKRKYPKSFIVKLSDSEGEAAETHYGSNTLSISATLTRNNLIHSIIATIK